MRYNYRHLSSSVGCKAIQPKLQTTSVKQEFEVDFQSAPSETTSELGKDSYNRRHESRSNNNRGSSRICYVTKIKFHFLHYI